MKGRFRSGARSDGAAATNVREMCPLVRRCVGRGGEGMGWDGMGGEWHERGRDGRGGEVKFPGHE